MLHRSYPTQDCAAAFALEQVGERWTLLILRDAMFRGYTRFSQFQKQLGIASNILATRLDKLAEYGILDRVQVSEEPVEYRLTQKGLELKPVIIALTQWGDKWVRPGPVHFVDEGSGQSVEIQLLTDDETTVRELRDVVARRKARD